MIAVSFVLIILGFSSSSIVVIGGGVSNGVIELGTVIRPSDFVKIKTYQQSVVHGDPSLRLKTNFVTANLQHANLTTIRYEDMIPFSAKGCVPVYYVADNPPRLTRRAISWIKFRQQWSIVLFANPILTIDRNVVELLARSVAIVGTFQGAAMAKSVEEKLLDREIMLIYNLVRNRRLSPYPCSYSGYLMIFDILKRQSVDLPLLANLVLINHGKMSRRCTNDRSRDYRMDVMSYDFWGANLPNEADGVEQPRLLESKQAVMFPDHYGTHLDAPHHLLENGETTEFFPSVERMFRPCIRVQHYNRTAANLLVGVEAFKEWETKTGFPIPDGSYVFVDTGNGRRWPKADEYLEIDPILKKGPNFMGIDPEAVRWLLTNRRIYGVGIDTISVDGSSSSSSAGRRKWETHAILAKDKAIGIENVGRFFWMPNLSTEPTMNPVSMCLLVPLRIQGGTGAPLAIFLHREGPLMSRHLMMSSISYKNQQSAILTSSNLASSSSGDSVKLKQGKHNGGQQSMIPNQIFTMTLLPFLIIANLYF